MIVLMRLERPILIILFIGLSLSGFGLLYAAATTPWHSDADAYFARLGEIRQSLDRPDPDFTTASRQFHANQAHHRTHKWLYADLGYAAIAWGGLIGAWLIARAAHMLGQTPRLRMVVMIALGSISAGLMIFCSAMHPMGRYQVPEWGDSIGIPMMAIVPTMLMFAFIGLIAAIPIWVGGGATVPNQLIWGTPHWWSLLATLLYLPFILLGGLLIFYFWSPGGWASLMAGFALVWIALEGRAAALTAREP
jgi:hypothetical protein